MGKYFECNLMAEVSHLEASAQASFKRTAESIRRRHEKLEEALVLSKMRPADFAATAAKIFDTFRDRFEAYTAEDLAEAVKVFYDGSKTPDRIDWPNTEVVFDTRFLTNREWEDMRHFGIGGSDAAVVHGVSPYRTARELFYDKTGKKPTGSKEDKQAIFDRGHIIEDNVVEAFCKMTGAKRIPESRMFRSTKYPAATANIDAIVLLKGKLYVFEAKSTVAQNFDAWRNNMIPSHYIDQMRQYPAVLDDPRIEGTYIGCLFTDDLIVQGIYCGSGYDVKKFVSRFVPRNPDLEEMLLSDEQDFWDDYIGPREVPPYSGDPEKDQEVFDGYERTPAPPSTFLPAEVIIPDEDIEEILKKYDALDMKIQTTDSILKQQKLERDTLRVDIISLLNSKNVGLVDENDKTFIEIKYQAPKDRDTVDLEKLEVAYPDAFADCVSKKPQSPRFSLKHKQKWEGWKETYMEPPKPRKTRKK